MLDYTYTQVWEASKKSVTRHGFTIAEEDFASGYWVTHWQSSLSPYPGEGIRQRVKIQIEPWKEKIPENADKLKNFYVVKVQVPRECNYATREPMRLSAAWWAPDGYNRRQERDLVKWIESYLAMGTEAGSAGN